MEFPKNIPSERGLNGGIIYSVLICLAMILAGGWLAQYTLAPVPPNDGFFYDWQLAEPSALGAVTYWGGFALHNLLIWLTIWWAQNRTDRAYVSTLRPVNMVALGINVLFIGLHYLQTLFFYDGIAQDVPSWVSQFTVIMMLFVILAMENRRRGLFFGRKINFKQEFYHWLRDYHGYAFSFAVIFTFWFHPLVPTQGHLLGALHVMLVMVQGSLMFTRAHLNRNWRFLLEILVLPHAALVAMGQGGGLVYMFLYGFMTIFIVTQMHGLGLKPWVKYLFGAGYLISILITYTLLRPPFMVNEVIRIPLIDYLMIFATYGVWLLLARLGQRSKFMRQDDPVLAVGD